MTIAAKILKKIDTTPLVSHSAMRLLELTRQPEYRLADAVRIIEADALLTARAFRVVNSAAFGLRSKIDSISRATTLLGDKTIVGMAIAQSQSELYQAPLEGYDAAASSLWEHNLRTAIASRLLADCTRTRVSSTAAYTAGILHDIGKAIIASYMKGKTATLVEQVDHHQDRGFQDAERDLIGIDHCQAGAALFAHWGFPLEMENVCRYHHVPADAPEEHRALTYVVHLGDFMAMMGGNGTGADSFLYPLDDDYTTYVDVTAAQINDMMMTVIIEFEKTKDMIFD